MKTIPCVLVALAVGLWCAGCVRSGTPATRESDTGREELEANWPGFRGPYGLGVVRRTNPPVKWDARTNTNILWKIRLPKPGFSSPVVWGDRLFVTGGDEDSREVYCVDAATGALLWTHQVGEVPGGPDELPEVSEDTGYAASTPATDGRRVFAIFASGNMVCVDMAGKRLWAVNLKVPESMYGHASSLITYNNMVFVCMDDDTGRNLYALEGATGEIVWEDSRVTEPSWSSPVIAEAGGVIQLIISGNPIVCGYRADTGQLLWKVKCMGGDMAPSPAFDSGLVFAANQFAMLAAVSPAKDGRIKWKADEGLPDVASPVASGGFLYVASGDGIVTCYESASGKVCWKREFETGFYSSPVIVGDKLYLTDMSGLTRVIATGGKYIELAQNRLDETVLTTPAFAGNRMYIRGTIHLWCIMGHILNR